MIKRTLYFGNPSYLCKENDQLKIASKGEDATVHFVPVEDIGFVVLDNPQITITHGLIQALQSNNVAVLSCDTKHHPQGLMLPIEGHSVQTERVRIQLGASEPLKKQLWMQTVSAKVKNQAAVLKRNGFESRKLEALISRIKSGDPENVEGRAAAVYWGVVMNRNDFTRDRYGDMPNAHLNYAYAILRAATARALVGSGLLPVVGIFHRNKYNSYCLADDIMEPYRPFCDDLVISMVESGEIQQDEITKEHKVKLLQFLSSDVMIGNRKSPLMVAISRTTNSLYECYSGERRKILYPDFYES